MPQWQLANNPIIGERDTNVTSQPNPHTQPDQAQPNPHTQPDLAQPNPHSQPDLAQPHSQPDLAQPNPKANPTYILSYGNHSRHSNRRAGPLWSKGIGKHVIVVTYAWRSGLN